MFISISFALLTAVTWGVGDFTGGVATKRAPVYSVILVGNLAALLVYTLLALAFGETIFTVPHVVWGGLAGLAGAFGLAALYQALSSGQMSLAAPLSAVVGAALPIVISALNEGLPAWWQLLGFGLALVGIWLVSSAASTADGPPINFRTALLLPLLAGVGFGLFFILINGAGSAAIFAPIVNARLAGLLLMSVLAWRQGQPLWPGRTVWPLAALSGLLDGGANVSFVVAAQTGRLDIASILSSLYPAVTVLLAWLLLKEQLTRSQLAGVVATLLSVLLIAA